MPRRGNIAKRDVLADPIYNSKMVTRLVNSVMLPRSWMLPTTLVTP